jgi:hypothetical protein
VEVEDPGKRRMVVMEALVVEVVVHIHLLQREEVPELAE